jgi:beta-mannanase
MDCVALSWVVEYAEKKREKRKLSESERKHKKRMSSALMRLTKGWARPKPLDDECEWDIVDGSAIVLKHVYNKRGMHSIVMRCVTDHGFLHLLAESCQKVTLLKRPEGAKEWIVHLPEEMVNAVMSEVWDFHATHYDGLAIYKATKDAFLLEQRLLDNTVAHKKVSKVATTVAEYKEFTDGVSSWYARTERFTAVN